MEKQIILSIDTFRYMNLTLNMSIFIKLNIHLTGQKPYKINNSIGLKSLLYTKYDVLYMYKTNIEISLGRKLYYVEYIYNRWNAVCRESGTYGVDLNEIHVGWIVRDGDEVGTNKIQDKIKKLQTDDVYTLLEANSITKAKQLAKDHNSHDKVKELNEEIEAVEAKIEAAKKDGKLLILEDKVAGKDSYQSVLVKKDSGQAKATAEDINKALLERYKGIKSEDNNEYPKETYDKNGIRELKENEVVIDFDHIKISDNGKIIYIDGDVFTEAAFKVAKGKGEYNGEYNITILTKDAPDLPGKDKNNKAAKIVVKLKENRIVTTLVVI